MLTVPIPLLAPDSSVLEENLIRSARRRTRRSCGLYFDNNNNYNDNDNKSRSSNIQNNKKCSSNMAERMIECLVGDISAEIDIICRDDPSYDHHTSMLARKRLDLGDGLDDRFDSKLAKFRVINSKPWRWRSRGSVLPVTSRNKTTNKDKDRTSSSQVGVYRLVTAVCQKGGRYKDDSLNSCLYDSSG